MHLHIWNIHIELIGILKKAFCVCLLGPVIGEALDDFILVLKTGLQPNRDPQMRLKLFTVLSQLLQKASETINSQG